MKYLLLLGLAFVVWWSLSQRRASGRSAEVRPEQNMVACELCGTYVPEGDAVSDGAGRRFCGVAHRDEASRREG